MTGREWKPGDVLLHPEFGRGLVVQYDNLGCPSGHRHTPLHVHYGDGEWDHINESRFRPLVVIDPEDREQVERIVKAYNNGEVEDEWTDAMQQVFRNLANPKPPKPDEPMGLGAVVEDEEGRLWVRFARTYVSAFHWRTEDARSDFRCARWQHVDAVRVLSEGVQP